MAFLVNGINNIVIREDVRRFVNEYGQATCERVTSVMAFAASAVLSTVAFTGVKVFNQACAENPVDCDAYSVNVLKAAGTIGLVFVTYTAFQLVRQKVTPIDQRIERRLPNQ